MTMVIGKKVRIEIGTAEGAPKNISALTKADPGVATSVAHGLTAKSLGYLQNVSGPVELEGQAVRLNPTTADTFSLEDIDTTSSATWNSGQIVPITAWDTLAYATSHESGGGGSGNALDTTVLLDDVQQQIQGQSAAQTVTINLNSMTISDVAMKKLRRVARAGGFMVFRVTFADGNCRFYRGQPSLPSESVQKQSVGTGSFTVTVKGVICEGAA